MKSPTLVKRGLLGLFWREECITGPFCEITATTQVMLTFGAFNFRKIPVSVKSISCVCHTASIVPFW